MKSKKNKPDPMRDALIGGAILAIGILAAAFLNAMIPASRDPEEMPVEELVEEMNKAVAKEDYNLAIYYRDIINQRKVMQG